FDVVYAREVEDDERALAEFARVLAPNGHVLVRLPALRALAGQHDLVVHGARRYTRAEVEAKLRRAGLTPLRSTYANSLLFPFVYMVRRWQRKRTAAAPSDVRPTPRLLNALLTAVLRLEAAWIRLGGSFPIGVSVLALAQKVEV
ncbi:MAG: methyltransferase type 11, partial [Anaerolineae bacterium]|nr:methyltransferase type 11 [Anaerolineae bacterium]